ncbi:MAG TPA: spore germination lipoprotein GerD [Bacilli bacterium]
MTHHRHYLSKIAMVCGAIVSCLLLSSCGSGSSGGGGMMSYKETKAMVIDILNTEDAKKIIQKSISQSEQESQGAGGGGSKLLSTPQGKQIHQAVKEVLADPAYPKMLKDMMTDPKFAGDFAKAIKKENKEIQKDLMKDPEYQKLVFDAMKNPDFAKMLLDVMKGPEYRKQAMSIMKESLESPLFRMELMDLFKKVLEEETMPKKQQGGGLGGGGGGQGGQST